MTDKQSKPLNIGQEPNNPQIQKQFAEALQAKNLGVNKILLNINGGSSEVETNRNAILKYPLKQPIQLEVGDVITCVSAFCEEKGLQENTISFEEDIETELRFLYYKQGDVGDELISLDDVGYVAYPKLFPDAFNDTVTIAGDSGDIKRGALAVNYVPGGPANYENLIGDVGFNTNFNGVAYGTAVGAAEDSEKNITSGCNGNYYYLMETIAYDKNRKVGTENPGGGAETFVRPVYGSKRISVKAGNYSVDSLANIISAQLNGSLGDNNNSFSDALLDKLYNVSGVNKNNFFATYPYFTNIDQAQDKTQSDLIGSTGESAGFERRDDGLVKQINYSNDSYYDTWCFQNLFANTTFTNPSERLKSPDGSVDNTFPNKKKTIVATPNFTLSGSGDSKEEFPPDYGEMNTVVGGRGYGDGQKNTHFYMSKKGIDILYDTPNKFYNLPGLKDNTANELDRLYPPFSSQIYYCTVDPESGYIPTYTANLTVEGSPQYNDVARYTTINRACCFQSLFPVKALKYPGRAGLEPRRQAFAGTSVAELTFGDAVSNRFAFTNFHEFYKLPNLTADGKNTTGYGGQQATRYNNPYFNDTASSSVSDNIAAATAGNFSPVYPVDSSSGIAINNFDFDLVKNTTIYKTLIAEIQAIDGATAPLSQLLHKEKLVFDLFTKPFDKFFATTADAENAWSKSLWSRLGFAYNQLGDVSSRLESFVAPAQDVLNQTRQQFGIITHNAFDFSKIVSSDGLGTGNPVIDSGTPMQNFRLKSYFMGTALPENLGTSGNYIHLLGESKPINAEQLPSLSNGKSYLLIESDIIKPNYKDTKANWGNLLAIMSKENATNDTIFGAEPIDFTVTEPRLLTDITIFIKNQDGSLANDSVIGKNNAFIIQIAKAIKVQEMPSFS